MSDYEGPSRVGEYRRFQLLVEKRAGGWRGYAMRDVELKGSSSAERVAFVVEDVSLQIVKDTLRSRVDKWSDRPSTDPTP
jgi:hypothetical protein